MPTKREQREATTAALREVAARLFAEHGYAGIGLEDVAAAAAVTRGAVYHHFRSKEGLFRSVLALLHEEVGREVSAAAGPEDDPWRQLLAGSRAFLAAASHPARRRIMLVDGPAVLGWEVWRELDAENSERLLREALEESGIEGPELDALTVMLSGAMNEAALWRAREGDEPAAYAALERLLEAVRPR